jgi:hypothetical protein
MVRIPAFAASLLALAAVFTSPAFAQGPGNTPASVPTVQIQNPTGGAPVTLNWQIEQTDLTVGTGDKSQDVTIVRVPKGFCKDANGGDLPESHLGFDQKTGALVGEFTPVKRAANDFRPPWSGPNAIKGNCPPKNLTMVVKKAAAPNQPAGGVRAGTGRRFDNETQSVFEWGGGLGVLFNFESTRVTFSGSAVGSGGVFNQSGVDIMPDAQLWANFRPAGWHGVYLGLAADVAVPTQGAQNRAFDTSTGFTGMSMIETRNAMLTLQGRVGMRDPILPGSVFVEGGIRLQDYRSTVRASFGNSFSEQFATDRLVTLPTVGIGARVPLGKALGLPMLRSLAFDTEVNFTPGSNGFSMPGGNSFSSASFSVRPAVSWLTKLEYEFGCYDP